MKLFLWMAAASALLAVAATDPSNKLILQVEKTVHDVLPARAERRFDEIGWAKDIRDAERLAKQHRRPVFLFTHDGKINTGRC